VAAQTAALTRTPSTQCPRSHHHMQQQLETALAQLLELEWWVLALLANSPTWTVSWAPVPSLRHHHPLQGLLRAEVWLAAPAALVVLQDSLLLVAASQVTEVVPEHRLE
jgi:hypothetical protein